VRQQIVHRQCDNHATGLPTIRSPDPFKKINHQIRKMR
jgi:hypothetical protein